MTLTPPGRSDPAAEASPASLLALIHGAFYLVTGIWPLVSIGTFQKVTGPKTDLWLVKTVGADAATEVSLATAWTVADRS